MQAPTCASVRTASPYLRRFPTDPVCKRCLSWLSGIAAATYCACDGASGTTRTRSTIGVVIWAGGYVRREDAANGDPLVLCAARELEEELRLQVQPASLRMIGAVYFDNGGSTSKHVGIAYEWKAETDDVTIVLSRSEFFEQRGTSLSGSFAPVDELVKYVKADHANGNREPWSVELIRRHLAVRAFNGDLFDTSATRTVAFRQRFLPQPKPSCHPVGIRPACAVRSPTGC